MKIIALLIGKNSFIGKNIYKELKKLDITYLNFETVIKKINYIQVDKEKI